MSSSSVSGQRPSSSRRSLSSVSTTTSLSQAINNIEHSKPAVVIDIGASITKCGLAGDFTPKVMFKTQFIDYKNNSKCAIVKADENGQLQPDLQAMYQFFKKIFYQLMCAVPHDRRVIIVESVLCATQVKSAISKVLMEMMYVPSVFFMPSHLAATIPFNTENALVVDVGFTETVAIAIAEGVTLVGNCEISPCGSRLLESRLEKLIREHGEMEGADGSRRQLVDEDVAVMKERGLFEDFSVRRIFCTSLERSRKMQEGGIQCSLEPPVKDSRIHLNGEVLIVPGFVRESACEVFFENLSEDEPSLQSVIYRLISHCSVDLRRTMCQGILMVGGATLIPGFLARLKAELLALAAQKDAQWCNEVKFFQFKRQNFQMFTSWLGASMYGSLSEVLQLRSVSRELWMDRQLVPDWTDFIRDRSLACGKSDLGA